MATVYAMVNGVETPIEIQDIEYRTLNEMLADFDNGVTHWNGKTDVFGKVHAIRALTNFDLVTISGIVRTYNLGKEENNA